MYKKRLNRLWLEQVGNKLREDTRLPGTLAEKNNQNTTSFNYYLLACALITVVNELKCKKTII